MSVERKLAAERHNSFILKNYSEQIDASIDKSYVFNYSSDPDDEGEELGALPERDAQAALEVYEYNSSQDILFDPAVQFKGNKICLLNFANYINAAIKSHFLLRDPKSYNFQCFKKVLCSQCE